MVMNIEELTKALDEKDLSWDCWRAFNQWVVQIRDNNYTENFSSESLLEALQAANDFKFLPEIPPMPEIIDKLNCEVKKDGNSWTIHHKGRPLYFGFRTKKQAIRTIEIVCDHTKRQNEDWIKLYGQLEPGIDCRIYP
jgi:hypothetical protein